MLSKRLTLGAVLPLCAVLISGCVTSAGLGAAAGDTPAGSTPGGGVSGTPSSSAAGAVASPSPALAPATLDVSPTDVRVGGVQMSLSFEPARHMFDQAAALLAEQSQAQPSKTVMDSSNSQGALVLSDMLKVTNNIDPSQPLPADGAQSIIRHVAVNVLTADNNQPVPYLGVTMDLLLDGHPVFFGQSVVPMVSSDANPPRVHYGNNIRLQQRGAYQVFIRLSRNPLLGQNQPQAAQFNVVVH